MPPPVMQTTISDRLKEEARRKRRDALWLLAYRVSVLIEAAIVISIFFWLASKGLSLVVVTECRL